MTSSSLGGRAERSSTARPRRPHRPPQSLSTLPRVGSEIFRKISSPPGYPKFSSQAGKPPDIEPPCRLPYETRSELLLRARSLLDTVEKRTRQTFGSSLAFVDSHGEIFLQLRDDCEKVAIGSGLGLGEALAEHLQKIQGREQHLLDRAEKYLAGRPVQGDNVNERLQLVRMNRYNCF